MMQEADDDHIITQLAQAWFNLAVVRCSRITPILTQLKSWCTCTTIFAGWWKVAGRLLHLPRDERQVRVDASASQRSSSVPDGTRPLRRRGWSSAGVTRQGSTVERCVVFMIQPFQHAIYGNARLNFSCFRTVITQKLSLTWSFFRSTLENQSRFDIHVQEHFFRLIWNLLYDFVVSGNQPILVAVERLASKSSLHRWIFSQGDSVVILLLSYSQQPVANW